MSWISRDDRIRTANNILENLKHKDISIKEPNCFQKSRGYIGSEEWIKEVYDFYCKPGSERTFYFPGNECLFLQLRKPHRRSGPDGAGC